MAGENEEQQGILRRAWDAAMRDGSLPGMAREAIKDVRSTIMEIFFGKPERGGEPGAPLNPLFHDIVAARKSHAAGQDQGPHTGLAAAGPTPSPSSPQSPGDIAAEPSAAAPDQANLYGQANGTHTQQQGVHGGQTPPQGQQTATDAAQPGRSASPGEIAYGADAQDEVWKRKIRGDNNDNQEGNADNSQNERARGRSLPEEQRGKGRGR